MLTDNWGIKESEKEDWKKAPGIKYSKGETNEGLASRDYSIECRCKKKICVIKGYFIWWCSVHHQPFAWCESSRLEIKINELKSKLDKIKQIASEE